MNLKQKELLENKWRKKKSKKLNEEVSNEK